jgi:hypothetical protein
MPKTAWRRRGGDAVVVSGYAEDTGKHLDGTLRQDQEGTGVAAGPPDDGSSTVATQPERSMTIDEPSTTVSRETT